jgi:hypothetical protein
VGGMPGFDAPDNFSAGGIWRKHLSEKGPEDNWEAVYCRRRLWAPLAVGARKLSGMESVQTAFRSPKDWADWSFSWALVCSDLGGRPKSKGPNWGRKGVLFLMHAKRSNTHA